MFSRKSEASTGAAEMAVGMAPDPIRIIYRTRTDRLNLAGAQLPHCSIAELRVNFPHYQAKVATCSAVVKTTPCSENATPFPERGITSTVTSLVDGTVSDASAAPSQAWSADIPLWEVQAIVASLEKLSFFRKQRTVLSAEVFLSVETGKHAVGKKYRPIAELDAMILRVVQHQSYAAHSANESAVRVSSLPARAELQRLPTAE